MAISDEKRGLSVGWLVALGLIVLIAYTQCGAPAGAQVVEPDRIVVGERVLNNAAELGGLVGQPVVARGVTVQSVASDEGFWVALTGGRVWVQLQTVEESPYVVHDGAVVSFPGTVVAHDASFPARIGTCTPADAQALAAQTAHIAVPVGELSFGVG